MGREFKTKKAFADTSLRGVFAVSSSSWSNSNSSSSNRRGSPVRGWRNI